MTGKDFDTLNEAYRSQVSELAPLAIGALKYGAKTAGTMAVKHAAKKAGQELSKRLKKDEEEETNEAQSIQVTNPGGAGKTQELSGSTRDVRATPKRKRKSKKKKSTAKKSTAKEAAKPDYIDADGDGDKKEPMKKAFKDKKKKVNEKATDQRPKDETDADEVLPDSACDVVHDDLQEPIEGSEKEDKKSKKTAKESINNSNKGNIMSENKSTFDELYESVMSEDEDFELGLPTEDETDGIDELELGDDEGDEGGDVTVTLSQAHVDCLKEILDQVGGGDDEGEEEFGDEPDPLEAGAHESSEVTEEDTQHTKDGAKPGVDPSNGGGNTTDAAGDSLGGKTAGTGDASVTDEIDGGKDTGEGKATGHTKAKNTPKV